jgi:DNA repair protein RecN (Recombination protein N)
MLRSIFIDNYALIDRLEIDFDRGLTIITGETGAGKSILLGALGLLMGKRADTAVLNDPERKCIVEGCVDIREYRLESFFLENELDFLPETILRREINSNGKSRAFINDTPVTLNVLQDLAVQLIDIHSQHQNLALNNEAYIRWIADTYAGTHEQLSAYQNLYRNFLKLKRKYEEARTAYLSDKENLDFLSHQFEELHKANLRPDELGELEAEHELLMHSGEIKSALAGSLQLLDDDEHGIVLNLKHATDQLNRIISHMPAAADLKQRMESAYIDMKDVASELAGLSEKMEFDPARMEFISRRIDEIYTLLRKYHVNEIEDLIQLRKELDSKLQQVATGDHDLENLLKESNEQETRMLEAAAGLSAARQKIFTPFCSKVLKLIENMGMKHAKFLIGHTLCPPEESGIDHIEFLFSANENVAAKSISRLASGGELSRLMLAVKYLISNASGLPTIIFDEIDTGVSGDIADKVGNLIREMAGTMQVLNITHLPQVASKGDHHFRVIKTTTHGTVRTLIEKLDNPGRIKEIAKMLSGDSISDAAIENAKVLLNN